MSKAIQKRDGPKRACLTKAALGSALAITLVACSTTNSEETVPEGSPEASAGVESETETWRGLTPMKEARANHIAVLLKGKGCDRNCGKVLVAGGDSGWPGAGGSQSKKVKRSAELYDPVKKKWSSTQPMKNPRWLATAVLLGGSTCGKNCGKILVLGGFSEANEPGKAGKSAELYDPKTGKWRLTKPPRQAIAWSFAAIELRGPRCGTNCGKILVLPFPDGRPDPGKPQIFNPLTEEWSFARSPLKSDLGKAVLVAGPHCGRNCGKVLMVGASGASQLYDPKTDRWAPTAQLPEATEDLVALTSGQILTAGSGPRGYNPMKSSSYIYDAAEGRWRPTGSLPYGTAQGIVNRSNFLTAILHGRALANPQNSSPAGWPLPGPASMFDPKLTEPPSGPRGAWINAGPPPTPWSSRPTLLECGAAKGRVVFTGGMRAAPPSTAHLSPAEFQARKALADTMDPATRNRELAKLIAGLSAGSPYAVNEVHIFTPPASVMKTKSGSRSDKDPVCR